MIQTTHSMETQAATAAAEPQRCRALIVGCQPGVDSSDTLQILRDAGLAEQDRKSAAQLLGGAGTTQQDEGAIRVVDPSTATGVAELPQWLADVPEAHILALYQRPERPVAEALANGQSVEDALHGWCTAAESLLAVCRQNRRRVSMLDAHAAAAAPAEFLARLGERLKSRLPKPSIGPVDVTPETLVMDRVVAALAVQQSEAAQALLPELEASSLPVSDPVALVVPDTETVVQQHKGEGETGSTRRQLEEENELLLLQLHQVQEELEYYYLKCQEKSRPHKAALAEPVDFRGQMERLQKDNRNLEAALERARGNIEDIKNSLSWKLTIPLRGLHGGPRRRKEAD